MNWYVSTDSTTGVAAALLLLQLLLLIDGVDTAEPAIAVADRWC